MHLYEDKNSPYTFIYISREYYNGKCLDENVIGIGQTKDPLKRLKEHNTKSSKTSTYVKFELVYKVKNKPDYFFHNILRQKGFPNVNNKKEIFRSSNSNILTIEKIQAIIEQQEYTGPWTINNDKISSDFSLSITNKIKQENQLKEKLNSYTQPCTESFNPKELIKFLNNKSLLYNQIHNTYHKNSEIQQWAYDNNKIKYAQLKNDLKLLNNNIIRAIKQNEINNSDFMTQNTITDINKLYIISQLANLNLAPILRLDDFTRSNHNEISKLIKTKSKLTITQDLKTYIEQKTKEKYILYFSLPIDLPEITYLLKNNIVIFEHLHPNYKNNQTLQQIAYGSNLIQYKELSDNLKLNYKIIQSAINKSQFDTQYITDIKNNPNILTELFNIIITFNLQLQLNDYSKSNIEFIVGAYKNKIIQKNHLSEELYQYILQNHKWDIYTPKIKNIITKTETKQNISIPKINYTLSTSFFDYIKIIIPVVVISLSLTLGFIFFMNHYNNQIKEILSTLLGYALIIGLTILIIWASKTNQL